MEETVKNNNNNDKRLAAVILIGGPTGATQFRPLSLDVAKPLFPIAGKPMIYHHIAACSKVKGLEEVFLLGDFPLEIMGPFIESSKVEFKIKITYLLETRPLGTAGGLFHFKDKILGNGRNYFFVLHSDICCTFPLEDLLGVHCERSNGLTMMGTKVDKAAAPTYGCYVADANNKMLHYAEHPESFISDTINAGVYILSPSIFTKNIPPSSNYSDTKLNLSGFLISSTESDQEGVLSMERDLIPALVNDGKVGVYEYKGFWRSIKNAGGAVFANEQYMNWYANSNPNFITTNAPYEITGHIIVDPTAQIAPTAKIGPNVYIGPNVKIGGGTRVHNSIILENVAIKEHVCVMYTIIGQECSIGAWSRIEGLPNATAATLEGQDARFRRLGITVMGKSVVCGPEIIIWNCIILPHKALKSSVFNEIIL